MQRSHFSTLLFLFTVYFTGYNESAKILAIFQLPSRSHFGMLELFMKSLAARGHEVHVVSHFPQKTKIPNYIDLSIQGSLTSLVNNITIKKALNYASYYNSFTFFWGENVEMCKNVMEHSTIKELISTRQKYDLVITELFSVDCFLAFGHKFKAPVLNLMTTIPLPWSNDRVGNPDNPSYIPNYFTTYTDHMTFTERLINTITVILIKIGSYVFSDIQTDRIIRQHFGEDVPPVSELKTNVSVVLANSHFSLHQPRPLVQAMVEVAGMHIAKHGKLPKDIDKYLEESEHGVIYFSLGSLIKSETFSEESLRAITTAFGELSQRVLWKCECDSVADIPPNVKTLKWMPQSDILHHANVRVFITHGGLMGTLEAVDGGVPMVGLPFFSDQYNNLDNYKRRGMAIVLDPRSLSKDDILNALNTILTNSSYKENAMRQSRLFRDRPQTAMETAIFWTEYVMRHHGAPHLQSPAVHMPLYQYLLMDVIAFLLLIIAAFLALCWFSVGKLRNAFTKVDSEKIKGS